MSAFWTITTVYFNSWCASCIVLDAIYNTAVVETVNFTHIRTQTAYKVLLILKVRSKKNKINIYGRFILFKNDVFNY